MPAGDTTAEKHDHADIHPGMHLCSIYRTDDEQFSPLVPFFSDGHANHDRCIYIFDEYTPEKVQAELIARDAASTADPAHLQFIPGVETYTQNGVFDADRTVETMRATLAQTLKEQYSAMRAAGEMSWALKTNTPLEKLFDYEMKLNTFIPENKVVGICEYDERLFPKDFLIDMIVSHPFLLLYGKLYQNKYLYTDPKYGGTASKKFKPEDYETMLSVILEDTPVLE